MIAQFLQRLGATQAIGCPAKQIIKNRKETVSSKIRRSVLSSSCLTGPRNHTIKQLRSQPTSKGPKITHERIKMRLGQECDVSDLVLSIAIWPKLELS